MRASSAPGSGSLWRLPTMLLLAGYTVGGFTGFSVTMSALPSWLAARGTPESLAGLATTVLLVATVVTQILVPRLVQRAGLARVLAAGAIALGVPSLLLLADGGLGWVLGICAVRGFGFGILTVLGSTMVARIVPVARRGEAIGIYGLSIAVPNLLAVPGGVALVAAGNFVPVAVIGATPLLSLLAVPALARSVPDNPSDAADSPSEATTADPGEATTDNPGDATAADSAARIAPAPGDTGDAKATARVDWKPGPPDPDSPPRVNQSHEARLARRAARIAAIGPAGVLLVITMAGGGFLTYLPIERPDGALATVALLVWGVTGALARWRVGRLADRVGLRRLLPGSSAIAVAGMGIVVTGLLLGGTLGSVGTVLGAAVLGTGYGSAQNLTLVAAFARARQRETATVSSVWNVGFDTGTAVGAAVVGALTTLMAVPWALAVTALLVAASIPLAVRSGKPPQ